MKTETIGEVKYSIEKRGENTEVLRYEFPQKWVSPCAHRVFFGSNQNAEKYILGLKLAAAN